MTERSLVCPACLGQGLGSQGGQVKIGWRASHCALCNRFRQRVRRFVTQEFERRYPDEVPVIRKLAEQAVYDRMFPALEESISA